jgi:hypothetical protein
MHTTTLAAFIRRHWPACRSWPREQLLEWVRWYQVRDLVLAARADDSVPPGRIFAVVLGRPVESIGRAKREPYHYLSGSGLWYVDLLVCVPGRMRSVIAQFFRQGRLRLGQPSRIGWERWTCGRAAQALAMEKFARRFPKGAT